MISRWIKGGDRRAKNNDHSRAIAPKILKIGCNDGPIQSYSRGPVRARVCMYVFICIYQILSFYAGDHHNPQTCCFQRSYSTVQCTSLVVFLFPMNSSHYGLLLLINSVF